MPDEDLGAKVTMRNEGEVLVLRLSRAARDTVARSAGNSEAPGAEDVLAELADVDWFVEDGQELMGLENIATELGWLLYCLACVSSGC